VRFSKLLGLRFLQAGLLRQLATGRRSYGRYLSISEYRDLAAPIPHPPGALQLESAHMALERAPRRCVLFLQSEDRPHNLWTGPAELAKGLFVDAVQYDSLGLILRSDAHCCAGEMLLVQVIDGSLKLNHL
jgi:hypothetical protein